MTKEQKQLTVIVVGVVILAVVLISNRKKAGEEGEVSASEETAESAREEAAPEAKRKSRPSISSDVRKKQEAALAKPYGRDPFTLASREAKIEEPKVTEPKVTEPKVTEPKLAPISLSLRAISVREGAAPMAVINNSITRIGDKFGDVKVVGIYKDYVLLKRGGREYKLELEE